MHSKPKLKGIINEHFCYEVTELCNSKSLIKEGVPPCILPQNAQAFVNMYLEHALLHSRNLYEFFFDLRLPPRVYTDTSYPRANMCVPPFTAPGFTSNIKPDFYEKVCNQILHLGIDRTGSSSDKFKTTECPRIANDLLRITKGFLVQLEAVDNRFYFCKEVDSLKANIDRMIQA
jgi:hypothetical protein